MLLCRQRSESSDDVVLDQMVGVALGCHCLVLRHAASSDLIRNALTSISSKCCREGHNSTENTWEPAPHCRDAHDKIKEYERKVEEERKATLRNAVQARPEQPNAERKFDDTIVLSSGSDTTVSTELRVSNTMVSAYIKHASSIP